MPLAEHFLRNATRAGDPPKLDVAVRNYLLQRDYPGNVRDLKQVLMRIMSRHTGEQTVTIWCTPSDERPSAVQRDNAGWLDSHFERQIHRAVLFGAGLKEIGRAAEESPFAMRPPRRRECASRGLSSRRH